MQTKTDAEQAFQEFWNNASRLFRIVPVEFARSIFMAGVLASAKILVQSVPKEQS